MEFLERLVILRCISICCFAVGAKRIASEKNRHSKGSAMKRVGEGGRRKFIFILPNI